MAKPYSMDLRQRALARLEEGETSREVAAALKVAVSSVIKWAARKRRWGSAAPGKMGGHRPYLIDGEHRAFVLGEAERGTNVTSSGLLEYVSSSCRPFGFARRFAATGLLSMTLIVEITVPDGWPIHITWAMMALATMAWEPGRLSIDYAIRRLLALPTSI